MLRRKTIDSCVYGLNLISIRLIFCLQYYYEPVTGRRFRSRTEVLYYLEHGTSKKGSKKADFNPDVS